MLVLIPEFPDKTAQTIVTTNGTETQGAIIYPIGSYNLPHKSHTHWP